MGEKATRKNWESWGSVLEVNSGGGGGGMGEGERREDIYIYIYKKRVTLFFF